MYILGRIITDKKSGFNLSNSEVNVVNGDYHKVIIEGIAEDNYTAIEQYLIDQGKIDSDMDINLFVPIYTNEKCYVIYGDATTYIIPISGSNDIFYYRTYGAAELISDMQNRWMVVLEK